MTGCNQCGLWYANATEHYKECKKPRVINNFMLKEASITQNGIEIGGIITTCETDYPNKLQRMPMKEDVTIKPEPKILYNGNPVEDLIKEAEDKGRCEALKEVLNKFVSGINSNEFHKWLIKRLEELGEAKP